MWSKIQKQLKLLGYYDAEIDNIPGPKTAAAICAALGIDSLGTAHFTEEEVKCPCCGECLIEPETLEMAEKIRAHFGGRPYTVSSGYRCKKHNREVGGVANSRHIAGKAIDGKITGVTAAEAVKAAYAMGCRYAYAIDTNFFHFDII